MPAPDFLDTNILLYAYDPSDRRKQLIAHDLMRNELAGQMLVSTQILAEYAAVPLHKLSPQAPPKYLCFYDGMIVAAAQRGGCQRIRSEDFNAGQKYFGIVIENPFRDAR
jgi:predicted nucleic acid-binding protein